MPPVSPLSNVSPIFLPFCWGIVEAWRYWVWAVFLGRKGKSMALYEHIFLSRPDLTPQQVDGLVEQYKSVLEAHGGKVGRVENWGLRSLTYRIRKNRKAYYTLMDIDALPQAISELERQMRINEDVLRFLTLRVEAHEEGPSVMVARRDRDDRPFAGKDGVKDSRHEDRAKRPRRAREEAETEGEE